MDEQRFPEIEAMRMGVDYRGTISIRGFKVGVRPLSIHETMTIAHEVAEDLAMVPERARTSLMEHVILAKKTLIKATSSDVGAIDTKITDQALNRMTPDEICALFKEYAAMVDRVNPILEQMPVERLSLLVEHLKKNPSEATQLSFLQLVQVLRSLLTQSE